MNSENTIYYWINLPERYDRRIHMLNEFKNHNIKNHVRITPIKHSDPGTSCTLSHVKAIETAYLDNCEYAVILEDDICLENIEKIREVLKKLPKDWEVFQCYTLAGKLSIDLCNSVPYQNHVLKGYFMSAACYVLNRKSIQTYYNNFIKNSQPIFIDWKENITETNIYLFMNTYCLLYPLLTVIKSQSSILETNAKHALINIENLNKIKDKYDFVFNIENINPRVIELGKYHHWYKFNNEDQDEIIKLLSKCEKYNII